ncbi:Glycosyltransferase involved in cell wall bisynthesis [Allopseudospirillum japonicum]|uniref:Glycosyltransferase involved in cell wall bisynthesis n=1 Tax=Allopseudospirillum japonicum TaxID=64971 RepID=A0A1H6S8S5_9GAMM|nr:glycosyltransferase family 1 protein [Allopseudospirillum japonicum]SEI60410.1 Glycosyltransferase involved in cell wall bisynthesis [Allopseudospirillum japonicum]
MLRLGLVTETFAPDINGVSHTLQHLVKGLLHQGWHLDLVRPKPRQSYLRALDPSGRLCDWHAKGIGLPGYQDLQLGLGLPTDLRRHWSLHPPHVLYIATEGPLGFAALKYAQSQGIPVVSGFHTNFQLYTEHYGRLASYLHKPTLAYLRWFHNATHTTLVPNQQQALELGAQGLDNVHCLYRGVDTQRFNPQRRCQDLRRQWQANSETLVVTCVGRLAAEKNLDQVIETFQLIKAQHPDARLVLTGDGPLHSHLMRKTQDIILPGTRTGIDLARHYASCDLFLFPSTTETFGNVILEAMASGLPVLSYDYAGAQLLIEQGVSGYKVPLKDQTAFNQAALELAAQPVLRTALATGACKRIQAFSWDTIVQNFIQYLMQARAQGVSCHEHTLDHSLS